MWIFLITLLILTFCYQIFEKKSESDFMFFLSHSKILSKEELTNIKNQDKELQINYLFQNKLISLPQKKQLLKLIKSPQKKEGAVNWFLKLILLGIGCILLGSIALVARNWHEIPDYIKILTYLGIFCCSTFLYIRYYLLNKKQKTDFLGFFNIGWILVGIALTGQIFHLTGSFWNAVLLGAFLSIPFVFTSQLKHLPTVWMLIFCLSAAIEGQAFAPMIILLTLPVTFYYKSKKALSVIWIITFILSLIQTEWFQEFTSWYHTFFMPVAGALIAVSTVFSIWVLLHAFLGKTAFVQTLKAFLFVFTAFSLFNVDYTYSSETIFLTSARYIQSVWGLFACAWMPFAAIGLGLKKNKNILFALWGICFFIAFIYSFITTPLAGLIFTLFIFSILTVLCVKTKNTKGFNFCLLVIMARLIVQYIEYVAILAVTGIGFIIVGVVIILLTLLIKYIFNMKKESR